MRWMCHLVPVLACASALSGCFLFHGGECAETVVRVCCDDRTGREVPATNPCPLECPSGSTERSGLCPADSDAGTGTPDAGPTPLADAGPSRLMCSPLRGAAACSSPWAVPAGQTFDLPVELDACACCPETECAAETGTEDGEPVLRITTTMCPDPCDCDACFAAVASCEIPPLAPGRWHVAVNGAPAYELNAEVVAPGLVPGADGCATFGPADACAISERVVSRDRPVDRLCTQRRTEGWTIRMEVDCPGCGELLGPCEATVEERFTDDLPPGGEIRLSTRSRQTECDIDCGPGCAPASLDCRLPELDPGGFYRVWRGGELVGSFTEGEPETCFEIAAPPPGP